METEHLLGNAADAGAAQLGRGTVLEADVDGSLVVVLAGTQDPVRCHVLQTGGADGSAVLVARDAVLVWHSGNHHDWGVVLGRIGASHAPPEPRSDEEAEAASEELVIEATRSLTLKCGDGSITIREDGRILIKGKDLVSHAQRTNRIRGGSVAIN